MHDPLISYRESVIFFRVTVFHYLCSCRCCARVPQIVWEMSSGKDRVEDVDSDPQSPELEISVVTEEEEEEEGSSVVPMDVENSATGYEQQTIVARCII